LRDVINLDYNNLEGVEAAFKKDNDIACVIVEPIAANRGLILPEIGFLEGLRKLTKRYNALLIFDEVITGFRFCFGGIQNIFKINPDLTCLGKIIGGGFPLAGFGGKREIMRHIAPEGSVYQAGTLAGNPVAVSAGLKTLNLLKAKGFYEALRQKSIFFYSRMTELIEKSAVKVALNHFDSMFSLDFKDRGEFRKFFHLLLDKGIYFSPAPDEVCFLSGAHTRKDLDYTVNAADYALKKLH
jgi:glutamate-1-semialdehyde 2,1-aminomutase